MYMMNASRENWKIIWRDWNGNANGAVLDKIHLFLTRIQDEPLSLESIGLSIEKTQALNRIRQIYTEQNGN